ncbi:glyoxylase-like metal-dependent hydrolase (beta-lactamase superfamily II) [Thermocatellispora tengchongensis]|uniref:Glyoxylase-like metal-dependent hydrolase (Beta-lactamase superfamily II) n=1 Tax=Thermocatellispora tengchongensis TaxID=1073253 RepID=A0A840PDE6_9ACTN|nr:N-acyl homoserine lactonase family protein [Thermocatellispora tengchongensis]MBB5135963.1 glyoxylase-like metal-dependent hydrolase (beta-lactamase superfamily II) [Thermocatellispora tengchongensis]
MSGFRVLAVRYAQRDARRGEHFHGYEPGGDSPHPTAYYVWAAVSDRHTVVIDTGIAPERAARAEGLRYRCSPVQALAEAGVAAESVDHVVLTHLHYDHTGTAHLFPRARYVVQRAELAYWTGPWAERIARERWLLDEHDLARLLSARERGRVRVVDGDAPVLPGLSVHLVGGHTAGMQVVRAETARGPVVLASDASHFYENLETDRPFPILHSMTGVYGAFDRIRELAGDPGLVVAGHDPLVLERFPLLGADVAVIAP